MFGLFDGLFDDFRPKRKTETIVVAKPYCIPARTSITRIFNQYGVNLLGLKEKLTYVDGLPGLIEATVTVSAKQAVWAEYLLLRSHRFMLMSKPKNARNLEWASKHYVMPEAWNGKPLIEKNCKEGLKALKGAKKMPKCNCNHRFGTVYRSGSGHQKTCPVHIEYEKKQRKQLEKQEKK